MKLLIAFFLLSQFIAGPHRRIFTPASSGITYAGTCSNGGSGVTSTSCAISGVPAGATIAVGASGGAAATGVTDSLNGSATQCGTNLAYNGGSLIANGWYIKNVSSGSHTLTVNFAGTTSFTRINVMAFTGSSTTAPLDTCATGTAASGATATTNSFTASSANEMVAIFAWGAGGLTCTSAPSPYTFVAGSIGSACSAYGVLSAAGTYTSSINMSSSGQWAIMAMVLKQ